MASLDEELKRIRRRRIQEMVKRAFSSDEDSDSAEKWPAKPIEVTYVTLKDTIRRCLLVVVNCWVE